MLSIADNILSLKESIPGNICLIAVSKMQPVSVLMQAYQAGQRIFGENKAQELIVKQSQLPSDIAWHFIGHLQTNKVKYLAPFISLIHSIDSFNLLNEVNKEAMKNNRVIDCLLQFQIATEVTKFGLNIEEAREIMELKVSRKLDNVRITGVMGMSSFSDDPAMVRMEFRMLHQYFLILKNLYSSAHNEFREISMGMSGDYKIAIGEGSTMIRVGTAIFGERNY
jgi:PLP dependent protein